MATIRRALDLYETAPWQTRALLRNHPISGRILEPCVGDGSIVRVIVQESLRTTGASEATGLPAVLIYTNDLDPSKDADCHMDASTADLYDRVGPVDWVVTNPPYESQVCLDIVRHAVEHARVGVAMMLRLSFREPTAKGSVQRVKKDGRIIRAAGPRGPWLAAHPPSRIMTLPRYSFTGDGHSDSVTTEWVIWTRERLPSCIPPIMSLYNADQTYA